MIVKSFVSLLFTMSALLHPDEPPSPGFISTLDALGMGLTYGMAILGMIVSAGLLGRIKAMREGVAPEDLPPGRGLAFYVAENRFFKYVLHEANILEMKIGSSGADAEPADCEGGGGQKEGGTGDFACMAQLGFVSPVQTSPASLSEPSDAVKDAVASQKTQAVGDGVSSSASAIEEAALKGKAMAEEPEDKAVIMLTLDMSVDQDTNATNTTGISTQRVVTSQEVRADVINAAGGNVRHDQIEVVVVRAGCVAVELVLSGGGVDTQQSAADVAKSLEEQAAAPGRVPYNPRMQPCNTCRELQRSAAAVRLRCWTVAPAVAGACCDASFWKVTVCSQYLLARVLSCLGMPQRQPNLVRAAHVECQHRVAAAQAGS